MADDSDKLSGAEEYITAQIDLAEKLDPEQEKSLRDALEKLGTFALVSRDFAARRILLCYDPTRTSQKKLLQLIKAAGGHLAHIESEGSPLLGVTIFPAPPPAA
jgi:hypothetical protein